MAERPKGKWLAVSPARKMVMELMHHGRKVPTIPLTKVIQLGPLAEARREAGASWIALFMKAYGLVARDQPILRRCYVPYPWAHFYEHPHSECAVIIERELDGEQVTMGARIRAPENHTLAELDALMRYFRETPVEEVNYFRQTMRLGRLPWLLRRFVFWQSLYLSGFKRSKRFGTFMLSSLGKYGVEQCHPIHPLSTYLNYGPVSESGEVILRIIYDHRTMDGSTVARCMVELEKTLNTTMLAEVRASIASRAKAA